MDMDKAEKLKKDVETALFILRKIPQNSAKEMGIVDAAATAVAVLEDANTLLGHIGFMLSCTGEKTAQAAIISLYRKIEKAEAGERNALRTVRELEKSLEESRGRGCEALLHVIAQMTFYLKSIPAVQLVRDDQPISWAANAAAESKKNRLLLSQIAYLTGDTDAKTIGSSIKRLMLRAEWAEKKAQKQKKKNKKLRKITPTFTAKDAVKIMKKLSGK